MTAALPPLMAALGAVLLLCGCAGKGSLQEDVMPDRLGKFNFEELESSIYSVALSAAPIVDEEKVKKEETPVENVVGDPGMTTKSDHLFMISSRGQKFSCLFPKLETHTPSSSDTSSQEVTNKFPNISKILLPLTESACLMKTVGWWTYEYCHRSFVRQYHMEAGMVIGDTFYLGYYGNETAWTEEQIKVVDDSRKKLRSGEVNQQAYHSVFYENGTECDLTKKPRKAQVKVMCGVSGMASLADVRETDTCSYEIHVYTPLLCGVPYFKREQLEDVHVIKCSPLVSREKYEALMEEKRQQESELHKMKEVTSEPLIDQSDQSSSLLTSRSQPKKAGIISPDLVKDGHDKMLLLRRLVAAMASSDEMDGKDIEKELKQIGWNRDSDNAYLLQLLQQLENEERSKKEQDKEESEEQGVSGKKGDVFEEKGGVSEEKGLMAMEGVVKADNELEEGAIAELEVDDETLSTLENAVTNEVKQKLSELGLPSEGIEIKLDVTSMEIDDDEDEGMEGSEEEGATSDDSRGGKVSSDVSVPKEGKKKKEIKVIKLTVVSDSEESHSRKEQDVKDKESMSTLEDSYNTLWEDKEETSRKRKQSQL